ncbi:polysaccharide biosynthesis protein (plasmid) [Deinococcus proteolyticus MRP]|uniref:Polysaccharide biosynthesis protein n=2 Tax=Deinococcus proteolyticus TaxID=55148 RepID=F0RQY0_DEIPM|nr:polysaccharide biosynthesis protein [Deinococcus proteolyticus MRP]
MNSGPIPASSSAPGPGTPPGLRAGMLWTVAGQGVYSAAQWLMVIVLARSGGASDVGLYSLGLALTAPLFLLLGLQLRAVQATDAQGHFEFRDYAALRLPSMALGLAVTAVLAWLYPHASGPVWWLGVAKALEGGSDVMYGLMQQRERLDWIAQSTLLRGLLGLALLALIYRLTGDLTLATLGLALAGLATLLLFDLPRGRRLAAGRWWTWPPSSALLRLALPLGVVIGLVSLGTNLPRLFVERQLGREALGIYAALSYVTVAGSVFVVALGTALTTRLSQVFARGDRAGFVRLTLALMAGAGGVGLLLVLLSAVAGAPLLALLYGPAYAEHARTFFWLTLAGVAGYLASSLGFAVTAARRFREQLPLFAVVTAVLVLACWWLIPRYGLLGAAAATLIGTLAQLLGSWLIVRQALSGLSPGESGSPDASGPTSSPDSLPGAS